MLYQVPTSISFCLEFRYEDEVECEEKAEVEAEAEAEDVDEVAENDGFQDNDEILFSDIMNARVPVNHAELYHYGMKQHCAWHNRYHVRREADRALVHPEI